MNYLRLFIFANVLLQILALKCGDLEGSWSIGIFFGNNPFNFTTQTLNNTIILKNPILDCNSVTDVKASFVADPFLFFPKGVNNDWYLFFEVKNTDIRLTRAHGQIGTAVSTDKVSTVMGLTNLLISLKFMCIYMYI